MFTSNSGVLEEVSLVKLTKSNKQKEKRKKYYIMLWFADLTMFRRCLMIIKFLSPLIELTKGN